MAKQNGGLGKGRLLGSGLALVLMVGCAGAKLEPANQSQRGRKGSPTRGRPAVSNQAVEQAYSEIELAYKNEPTSAITMAKIKSFLKQYAGSNFIPSAENLAGLCYLKQSNPNFALFHFRRAVLNPSALPKLKNTFLYNEATAQIELEQWDAARESIGLVAPDFLDPESRYRLQVLRAKIDQHSNLPADTLRDLLASGDYLSSSAATEKDRESYLNLLRQSSRELQDIEALRRIYNEAPTAYGADLLLLRIAQVEMAQGMEDKARTDLEIFQSKYSGSPVAGEADSTLDRLKERNKADSGLVGVLLPMTGRFAKFGARTYQAIQLAFKNSLKVRLVAGDSGDSVEQALKALEKLAKEDHVVAVIGPMVSKGLEQISEKAQDLGVPLIALSRKTVKPNSYFFQAGITDKAQTTQIADYAVKYLGLKKFAVLVPDSKWGEEVSQNFWDEVEKEGGQVTGLETYSSDETDFRQPIDKLSGLYYTDARHRELEKLQEDRVTNKITKKTRKTDKYYRLPPIVDYQAVFIPDDARTAGQVLPTFAYRDVDKILFLGLSAWNTPDFIARTESYANRASFVDAFVPGELGPLQTAFSTSYKESFGSDPSPVEGSAFDAANIVRKTLTNSGAATPTRSWLREQLKLVRDYPGVTGKISFQDGEFIRPLRIIAVKEGKFIGVR